MKPQAPDPAGSGTPFAASFQVDRLLAASIATPDSCPAGWPSLDALEVAFRAGELSLVAGRTGHAKTAFLLGLLANWLNQPAGGRRLLFCTPEESEVRVFHRLLSLLAARAGERWTAADIGARLQDGAATELLNAELQQLRGWEERLRLASQPTWSVDDLVEAALRAGDDGPVAAVLVDGLDRYAAPSGGASPAGRLKGLALHLDAPVVGATDATRPGLTEETRLPRGGYRSEMVRRALAARRPRLGQLRDPQAEPEADLILGLMCYRTDYLEDEAGTGRDEDRGVPAATRLDIGVLKSRYGVAGRWCTMAFEARCGLVREAEPGEEL